MPRPHLDPQRFLDCLILGPRLAFGRKLFDLIFAQFLTKNVSEFVVAPSVRGFASEPPGGRTVRPRSPAIEYRIGYRHGVSQVGQDFGAQRR